MTKKPVTPKKSHVFVKKHVGLNDASEIDVHEVEVDVVEKKPKVKHKKKVVHKKVVPQRKSTLSRHVEDQLAEIYENSDGSMPDMSSIYLKKRRGLFFSFVTLIVAALIFAAIVWTGFLVSPQVGVFAEEDVIVTVTGEDIVTSGDEVHFRIRYRNAQKINLNSVKLNVRYPKGFVYSKATVEPDNETHDQWTIGKLSNEDGGFIDITGKMYGNIDDNQSIRVFLNYIPENFSSEFQKANHAEIKTSNKPYALDVNIQKNIVSGVRTPIEITLLKHKDISEQFDNLYVEVESDGLFSIEHSTPQSDKYNQYKWNLDREIDEQKISIVGTFALTDVTDSKVKIKLYGESSTNIKKPVVLDSFSAPLAVGQTDVSAQLIINGSTNGLTLQPGEKMISSFIVKNDGDQAVENVRLRLRIDAPSADNKSIMKWAEINDPLDGDIIGKQLDKTTRRGFIGWSKKQSSAFASLAPGEQIIVDVQLPVKTSKDMDLFDFETYKMSLIGQLEYDINAETKTVSTNPIDAIIQSDLRFNNDYTFDSDTNNYALTWKLNNTFHDLKDIEISTDIFGAVTVDEALLETVPAGTMTFDKEKSRLTWKIASMPNALDVLATKINITLNKLNGGQTQLTDKIRLDAIDVVTGEKILIILDPIMIETKTEKEE